MGKGDNILKKALAEMEKGKPNLRIAFDFLNESAKAQNPEALYALGTWYLHGRFVKRKPAEAVHYFLQSIEGNNSSAYYDLAVCYEKGIGIKKNHKAAFECYLNAALLGDKQALFEIGRCYYYGVGVSKNISTSKIWLKHAELNGIS
jgi:uncharacterized protein